MVDVTRPHDDTNHHNPDEQTRSKRIKAFTKSLIFGGKDREWIPRKDHRDIGRAINTTTKLLSDARAFNEKMSPDELWAKGVNPDGLTTEISWVEAFNAQARNLARKWVTSHPEHIETLLSRWEYASRKLTTLVEKLSKEDTVLQIHAYKNLQKLAPKVQNDIKTWKNNNLIDTSSELWKRIDNYMKDYETSTRVLVLDENGIQPRQSQHPIANHIGENEGGPSHFRARASHAPLTDGSGDTNQRSPEHIRASLPILHARLTLDFTTLSQIIEVYEQAQSRLQNAIKTAQEDHKQIVTYIHWNNRHHYSELVRDNDPLVRKFAIDLQQVFTHRKKAEASLPPKIDTAQARLEQIGRQIQQELSKKADQLERDNTTLQTQFEKLKVSLYQQAQSKIKTAVQSNEFILHQINHYYQWDEQVHWDTQAKIGDFEPKPLKDPENVTQNYADKASSVLEWVKIVNQFPGHFPARRDKLTPKLWEKSKELEAWNPKLSDQLKSIEEQLETGIQAYLDKLKEQRSATRKYLLDNAPLIDALPEAHKDLTTSVNKLAQEADELPETSGSAPELPVNLGKLTDRFDSLATKSKELEKKFKALDFEVTKWNEVSLAGETAEKYNALVSIANPLIEQTLNFLQGFKGSEKEAIDNYIRDSKYEAKSIRQGLEFTASFNLSASNMSDYDAKNLAKLREKILTIRDKVNYLYSSLQADTIGPTVSSEQLANTKWESPFKDPAGLFLPYIDQFEKEIEERNRYIDTLSDFDKNINTISEEINTISQKIEQYPLSQQLEVHKCNQYEQEVEILEQLRLDIRILINKFNKQQKVCSDIKDLIDKQWQQHPHTDQDLTAYPFSLVVDQYKKRGISSTSSPPIMIETQELALLANKITYNEKILSNKIRNRHVELLKQYEMVGRHPYFLKRRNDFTPDPSLTLIKGKDKETCAIACVIMVLADGDKTFLQEAARDKIFTEFQLLNLEEGTAHQHLQRGEINSHKYKVLNQFYHPYHSYEQSLGILYEKKENMSFKELQDNLGQCDKNGKRMPIIVTICRPDQAIGHAIIIDYIRDVDDVEYVDIRDPYDGERYSISRDDFVEFWEDHGIATVPRERSSREGSRS